MRRYGAYIFSLLVWGCGATEGKYREAALWVKSQGLPAGTQRLALPQELSGLSVKGEVDAVISSSGRLCMLFKTSIGYKDNYEGAVWCEAPLSPSEIHSSSGRAFLSLGNPPLEELYLREQRAPHWFDVFFDLN